MSSLSRVNIVAQQRIDLQHLLATESYTAFDFRALVSSFTGSNPYILSGFEVIGRTGLAITINVQDALTFNPLDGNGSFYKGLPADDNIVIELSANQENLFVEAKFVNITQNPVDTALWDPLALTGDSVAGTEFSASINSQVIMNLVISANSVGFTVGAIPILRASTDGSNVTKMIDCRPMLYRLGSGGVSPNPANKFPWGSKRIESVSSGTGVGDDPLNSPFMARDLSGALNDKALRNFKEWADAIMTRFCELSGSSLWYASDVAPNQPIHSYITGLDIQRIALDSESGHSIQPSENVSIKWVRNDPTAPIDESLNPLLLTAEGQDGLDDISVIKWQANYGPVSWELGGTFVNNTFGGSRKYNTRPSVSPDRIFTSPYIVDYGNLYLLLERDIVPPHASGNAVKWADNSSWTLGGSAAHIISGVTGDFTGIAVGDWIRKASEGFSQYYQVTMLSDGNNTVGAIADSTIVSVAVDRDIATGASIEAMMYFRSRYDAVDLVSDAASGEYNNRDSNYYWIGRRVGNTFILRGFGNLSEGEEAYVLNDSSTVGASTDVLSLTHVHDSVYSATNGYSLRAGATTTLLTIKKRKRDNLVFADAGTDNTDGFLSYTIDAPVGLMNVGDGLWVRLSDTMGGVALTAGPVVVSSDDYQNLDNVTNTWEILTPANNPLRNFDNKDVHLVARCIVLSDGVTPALQFIDGTVLDVYGLSMDHYGYFQKNIRAKADVYLGTKTPKSVLFIDETPTPVDGDPTAGNGRIDEDNASFNYDKTAQNLTLFNNLFGVNTLTLLSPTDQYWFSNLGNHSLYLGGSASDVVIPGNLTVLGAETISSTNNIATADKRITLGVGNGLYGGGGSGLTVADNTLSYSSSPVALTQLQSYAGQNYVYVTYSSDPGYVSGQLVGLISNFQFDQITESNASQVYTVVTLASASGQVQRMSATLWRFYTSGTALAGATQATDATHSYQTYDLLSEVHLGSSDDDPTYMTSWAFGVKRNPNLVQAANEGTIHAIVTPYESAPILQDFKTIPTGRQANFTRKNIPYAWGQGVGVGPGGSDTTFDFSSNFTWDYTTNTLGVIGTFSMTGGILPGADNLYDLGSTSLRWRALHVGPGSVYTHNDNTNTNWGVLGFTGTIAQLNTDSATNLLIRSASTNQLKLFTDKRGSFGLAQASSGDSGAIFEFGNDTTSPLSVTFQMGTKINHQLSGTFGSHLLHLAGVLSSGGTIASFVTAHIATPVLSAGSLTTHYGLLIDDLSVGINNYGIYSQLSKATNKWFVYGSALADSYFAGNVGIGNNSQSLWNALLTVGSGGLTPASGISFNTDTNLYRPASATLKTDHTLVAGTKMLIGSTVSTDAALTISDPSFTQGALVYGVKNILASSGSTSGLYAYYSKMVIGNTLAGYGYYSDAPTIISSVASYAHFYAQEVPVLGATPIYAFFSAVVRNAPGHWGLYSVGNAPNLMMGTLSIGEFDYTKATSASIYLATNTIASGGISFGGGLSNLYRSALNTLSTDGSLTIGGSVSLGTYANLTGYIGLNLPPVPSTTSVNIFAKNGQMWQQTSDGNLILLTNYQGDIYEETADCVASPSGNNQMAAISAGSTIVTMPQDSRYLIGLGLLATTVASGSKVVRITKINHGFVGGETVNIVASSAIDGIAASQMTGSFVVAYVDANNFTFTATAGANAIVGGVSGFIDRVWTLRTRSYVVGQGELEIYLNGVMLRKGVEWAELGSTNALSNQVTIYRDVVVSDYVTWRISANGGQTAIGTASDSTKRVLLSAMANNTGSALSMGTPVIQTLTGIQKVNITNVSSEGIVGLVFDSSIATSASGTVISSGTLESAANSFNNGDIIYIDASGNLTSTRPSVSGQYIIVVGVVRTNPVTSAKDLLVGIRIIKQLP